MASAFGHALLAATLGTAFKRSIRSWKFFSIGMFCSIFPDADVLSFTFGIPYEAFWGHRGFTHSLLFAFLLGLLVTILFYRKSFRKWTVSLYVLYFSLCTASHALLDAMTSGGLGVAFFSPWDNTRYFLPWRPIKVSPIGVENFFSEWGKNVLLSEFYWIGIPCFIFFGTVLLFRYFKKNADRQRALKVE